jgi:two-component system chemotaxis response regulator CheY
MKHILIVDDSRVIRKVAQRIVEGLGFRTREAADGAEALKLCQTLMPDAVLLDWNMPVMDGMGFLRELRQLEDGFKPKVIFCTTENEIAQITRAVEAGADEYIMKPFDRNIIVSKLEEVGLIEA